MKLFILAALPLLAQTGIKPDQLKSAAPVAPRPVILAFSATGFTPVTLGPGLSATLTATGWTIDASATTKLPTLTVAPATRNADGTYQYTDGALFRNGMLMTPGVDYTVSGANAVPKTPWAADDTVTVLRLQ